MDVFALTRYMVAATLARGADAGAAVGLVLLAVAEHEGAGAGGLLAVALTAPHLAGPWLARQLDRARDGRGLLAGACLGYASALAAGALLVGRVPVLVAAAPVVVAGACGPLLTGGMSSRLAGIAGGDEHARRRAEGLDAISYGVSGTAGPAAVAALAAVSSPLAALEALAGAAAVAAAVTLTLPAPAGRRAAPEAVPPVRVALRRMVMYGPLRRVTVPTLLTAFSFGAVPSVIAVVLGSHLSSSAGAGATLGAAFGLGNLAGSLLVTAFPLRGEPDVLTIRHVALMAAALGLCALAPSYGAALAAFALAGASNAPFFTATLAARSEYSPPEARAQVFVALAAAKIAASSAGTALAGAAIGLGPRPLLAAGAVITAAGAAASVLDRGVVVARLTRRRAARTVTRHGSDPRSAAARAGRRDRRP